MSGSRWGNKLANRVRLEQVMERRELRFPSEPRVAPAGPVSMPIKTIAPAIRAAIDEALAKRTTGASDRRGRASCME